MQQLSAGVTRMASEQRVQKEERIDRGGGTDVRECNLRESSLGNMAETARMSGVDFRGLSRMCAWRRRAHSESGQIDLAHFWTRGCLLSACIPGMSFLTPRSLMRDLRTGSLWISMFSIWISDFSGMKSIFLSLSYYN